MSVRTSTLRWIPPFVLAPPHVLRPLATLAQMGRYQPGELLFRIGEPCNGLIALGTGYVRLSRPMTTGKEATVGIIRPGGLLSTTTLYREAVHRGSAEAISAVATVEFPGRELLALAQRSPAVLLPLLHSLIFRIDDAWSEVAADAEATVQARTLHVLRRLAQPRITAYEDQTEAIARLAVRLSHADIARLVGAERASVTRALHHLANQGMIVREHGHVTGIVVGRALPE